MQALDALFESSPAFAFTIVLHLGSPGVFATALTTVPHLGAPSVLAIDLELGQWWLLPPMQAGPSRWVGAPSTMGPRSSPSGTRYESIRLTIILYSELSMSCSRSSAAIALVIV
jgi:hypothetical protein